MTAEFTLDQIATAGGRVTRIEGSSASGALRRVQRAVDNRISNLFMRWMVARGREALRGDEADLARFANRIRALSQKFDRPTAAAQAMIDADAVRSPGPGLSLPAPPTPAEWFTPRKGVPSGFVFYVHGGSFILERSPSVTALVARFAAAARASVFAPNYRLAPEHPCPAAVDDIVAAWRWFKATYPNEPVVAVAESAGGAILLAALQQARDDGFGRPDGVVLLSPWVDLSLQSWSVVATSLSRNTPRTMDALALTSQLYLNGRAPTDPVASPIFGDFADFPPTLIHASETDIVYDDAVRLADRIRATNTDLTIRLWSDEAHVWERAEGEQARRSIEMAADFIRRRLD